MNIGTAANPTKVTLDTNIIISSIGFGGKPRKILGHILEGKLKAVISPVLLAELEDVIAKKFPKLAFKFKSLNRQIRKKFQVVRPTKSIDVVKDDDDNRVLEAAVEGKCDFVITGDRDLLNLEKYKGIKIIKTADFLKLFETEN